MTLIENKKEKHFILSRLPVERQFSYAQKGTREGTGQSRNSPSMLA